MRLSLDTSVVVDILRGDRPDFRLQIEAASARGDEVCLSAIVVHELAAGALLSQRPQRRQDQLDALVNGMPAVEFTPEDAVAAAGVRDALERGGRKIGALDVLIAGQAMLRGWAIVTRNTKHFLQVQDLQVFDWSVSDQPLDRAALAASLRRPQED